MSQWIETMSFAVESVDNRSFLNAQGVRTDYTWRTFESNELSVGALCILDNVWGTDKGVIWRNGLAATFNNSRLIEASMADPWLGEGLVELYMTGKTGAAVANAYGRVAPLLNSEETVSTASGNGNMFWLLANHFASDAYLELMSNAISQGTVPLTFGVDYMASVKGHTHQLKVVRESETVFSGWWDGIEKISSSSIEVSAKDNRGVGARLRLVTSSDFDDDNVLDPPFLITQLAFTDESGNGSFLSPLSGFVSRQTLGLPFQNHLMI